jgi:uncharacterized membrane protein
LTSPQQPFGQRRCQALLAYLLGAVILATTINRVAGLLG